MHVCYKRQRLPLQYVTCNVNSGVTKGGHLPPGAAFWGLQIEGGMLRNNYKMSNAGCYPVA